MFCRSGLRAAIGAAAIAARRPLLRKALLHAADGLFFCTRTAPAIRHAPRPAPTRTSTMQAFKTCRSRDQTPNHPFHQPAAQLTAACKKRFCLLPPAFIAIRSSRDVARSCRWGVLRSRAPQAYVCVRRGGATEPNVPGARHGGVAVERVVKKVGYRRL